MRIAVLGGGHGAYAAAADLSEQGHDVRLWRRDAAALKPVLDSGAIKVKDIHGERAIPIARASADFGETIRGAQLVLIPAPATAQEDIARELASHLTDGQVVFLPPGTFGSYVMSEIARAAGSYAEVTWAETGTLPYLARKQAADEVRITIRAARLPTGAYPAKRSEHAFSVIRQAYPVIEPCEDALSGALMNAGPIIHPPLILMNAAPLQHFERWDIHNEGTQASIRRVTDALDAERIAVREALGYGAPHFPLADHYRPDGEEWMYGRKVHKKLTDSKDWSEKIVLTEHRYMREDVEQGLAFLVSVAEWAGVACPVASGLLSIASAVVGRDLRACGRTLESLGLRDQSRESMRTLLGAGL